MRAGLFVTTIESITEMGVQDTRHYKLAFAPGTVFEFEAGQFFNAMIPNEVKVIKRPYSIASSPNWKGFLDLCIKKVPGGLATEYIWTLKQGDKLEIQGPLGRFCLSHKPLPKRVVFISTGTGIAPFRSMIHDLLEKKADVEIWNIFGNRYEEDVLYKEEFEELERKHTNFRNVFTVSRPKKWTGETQYVQHMLTKYITSPEGTNIYICGLTNMILEVERTALEAGFTKQQIHYEKYD